MIALMETQSLSLGALFLLGFLGSGHCVGMCGPLVLAFPGRRGGWAAHLAYHCGRILTYTAVGLLLGGVGSALQQLPGEQSLQWTARLQVGFSLLAALFLALFGLTKLGFLREPRWLGLANPGRFPGFRRLQQSILRGGEGGASQGGGLGALFLLGLLLGFLPCGLSFAAFARALGSGDALWGGSMTLVFGLGTQPALFAVGRAASALSQRHRRLSDLIAGMLMIGMAAGLFVEAFEALA